VAGAVTHEAEFDLRYEGQEYSLALGVKLVDGKLTETPEEIGERFGVAYERNYGHRFDVGVTIVSVRAVERTLLPRPSGSSFEAGDGPARSGEKARAYSFVTEEWLDFEVIDREALQPGEEFQGPAIVLEPTTTSYFDVGERGVVHATGALVVTTPSA
jgi:N-methylhydantoinase A